MGCFRMILQLFSCNLKHLFFSKKKKNHGEATETTRTRREKEMHSTFTTIIWEIIEIPWDVEIPSQFLSITGSALFL
jgi:hypothetical protein